MEAKLVETKSVTYHRNGISGESFWTVRFRSPQVAAEYGDPSLFAGDFLATVPTDALDDGYEWKKGRMGECFVIYLADPGQNWRGDHFATEIKKAIKNHAGRK